MCGIAGWFAPKIDAGDAERRLGGMLDAIRHRGPDGSGTLIGPQAALGHVRLAIIDLAGGAQPMQSDGVAISFNGEIYNYRELRTGLEGRGYRFRTRSDTEAILALYRMDGWPALSRLRGMYALALWDEPQHCGYLIRDPQGIKPLFWARLGDALIFGSEAKAILAQGALRAELNEPGLHLVMNYRYLPGADSLFRGIRQVPAGGVVRWTPERLSEKRLPVPDFPAADPLAALKESVRVHLTADVEVGAYLSGGIDSAVITAVAREAGLRRTFTLGVGDDPREAANAARSADLLGVENRQEAPTSDVVQLLPRLVRSLEVPKINSLQVSQLAAFAARHIKVCLSGLGGDELFVGYNAYRILYLAARVRPWTPSWLAQTLGEQGAGLLRRLQALPWSESERTARMLAALGVWPRVYALLRNVWDRPELRRWVYGPRMLDRELPDAFDTVEAAWPSRADPVLAAARYEWREKMVNDLLWQEDRVSMAEGLEVRVPLVDLPLAAAVARLERTALMPRGRLKGYMRELLRPLLPGEIMLRPKSGFQVDAPDYFHRHLMGMAEEWLSESRLREYGLFNPAFVRQVLAAPPQRRYRWHYFMLYLMLMTHLWMQEFLGDRWDAG